MSIGRQNEPLGSRLVRALGPSTEERQAWFHHMQETQPVRYHPESHLWEVFRYKDVQQVLLDSATFAKESEPDPAQHRKRRGLMSNEFTSRRIEELTPRLIQIVDELLEPARVSGKMNVVTELASPLPVRIIAELLGLPLSGQERVQQWSYQRFIGVGDSDKNELFRFLSDVLDERKRDPRDDLMSRLLAAEENEAHLTREEIISMCKELMVTGSITTMILLSRVLYRCCLYPEIYQALRDNPSLIQGAIEETLRYDFASSHLCRTTLHDTVLGGHQIKAGETVVAWRGAANFDETYFPHSEQFDIRRSPNPHLTFGYGVHVCLGHPLARLEGRILLERIVAHFSEIRLDPEDSVQYTDKMASEFIQSLGVLFTKACSPVSEKFRNSHTVN